MTTAIIAPSNLKHRVRGTGYYFENLKKALLKYCPNGYIFPEAGKNLPKEVDLVHYPFFEPFFLTLPFFRIHKTIVTIHDLTPFVFPKYFPKGTRGFLKWQLQRQALKSVNAIITDSQSSKKDIIKYAGVNEKKVKVIYLSAGEEFKQYQISNTKYQMLRDKYRLPDKFVLYVGDVTWNKNLPRLLEAVIKINVPLVMIGEALTSSDFDKNNPWNQDLVKVQKLAESNKKIIRVGFVDTPDLVNLYNIASVFVMPSLYEGFGLPVLEAMASGCPVVTTKEGSIPEVAGDAVYYVDPYNTDSIKEGVLQVFSNQKLHVDLSKKGLARAKKFSWKKTAEETAAVYEKVLG